MEIVSADGSRVQIESGQTRELGRSDGLESSDKTISRRHLSFFVPSNIENDQETRIHFEVNGRNPIYVCRNDEVKIFRRFDRGEMRDGDMFCLSAKDPIWYTLKKIQNCGQTVRENDSQTNLAGNLEKDGMDVLDINPVEEFGFVRVGHEFESYPKQRIRDIKNFDWFIEDTSKESDDEDEGEKRKVSGRRKRKKGADNDDEEWTGESEDDKELINKSRKAQKPKYITRSKDHGKDKNKYKTNSATTSNIEVDDIDDEDETLGGFIVDDENLEAEGEEEEEEEEEVEQDDEEIEEEYDEDE